MYKATAMDTEKKIIKYIAVSYKLYTLDEEGKGHLVEQTTQGKPFLFLSEFGLTLPAFEENIKSLATGDTFDFTLNEDQAYGEYEEERVVELDKAIFTINNHFDHEHIRKGAIVPLQNEDGNHFLAQVVDITDDKVVMDLNHPLAGKKLNFKGSVEESREATTEEIQGMINRMSGEGCGCGCDDCENGCGHDHKDGCGHDHKGGCGHCH